MSKNSNEISKLAAKINERFNRASKSDVPIIVAGADVKESLKPQFLPIGISVFDDCLGGGIAKGTVTTLYGTEGSGKTCAALMAVAAIQKAGGTAVWIDAEPPFPYLSATVLGVDIDSLWIIKPKDYGEQILDVIKEMLFDTTNRVTRGVVDLLVIDSINGLVPKDAIDSHEKNGYEGHTMGRRAAMLAKWFEELSGMGMLRAGTSVICIAQLRTKINGVNSYDALSGGNALKYFSKVIIKMGKQKLDGKEKSLGHTVSFSVEKNNIIGMQGSGEYEVAYGLGVNDTLKVVSDAQAREVIVKQGRSGYVLHLLDNSYLLPGGIDILRNEVRNNIELRNSIKETLKSLTGKDQKMEPRQTILDFKPQETVVNGQQESIEDSLPLTKEKVIDSNDNE